MDAREAGEEINRPGDCVQVPEKEKESRNGRISNLAVFLRQRRRF